jgi:hypothetical protein
MLQSTHTTRLPTEARAGLMRTWLAILRIRHPGVIWIPVAPTVRPKQKRRPDDHPAVPGDLPPASRWISQRWMSTYQQALG